MYPAHRASYAHDQRFPFLPFVTGLAISPLLFGPRPFRPYYYGPRPFYPGYPFYGPPYGFPYGGLYGYK
ncbi:penicillin-binding protein [Bacillus sp. AK128]